MKNFYFILLIIFCANNVFAQNTEENQLKTTVIGRLHFDGAAYFKDVTPLSNGATFNDVRLGATARYGKWSGKVEIGFANSKIGIKDVFAEYTINDNSYIKAGHFPEIFGLDVMEGSSNIKFLTPNATNQAFAPSRRLGVKYVYRTDLLWAGIGAFGDKDINNSVKGNDGYAFTGRVVARPYTEEGKIFHLGVAGSFRKADANGLNEDGTEKERVASFASNAETTVESTKFINAEIANAKNQIKGAVELIGAYGAFHFQGEYMYNEVTRTESLEKYHAQGVYGQIGFLAIGGKYSYSKGVARLAMPKARSLEFVARYNVTDLNNSNSGIYGGKMNDISIAANYYINKYVVLRLNYVNVNLDEHSLNGKENFNLIQGRIQFTF